MGSSRRKCRRGGNRITYFPDAPLQGTKGAVSASRRRPRFCGEPPQTTSSGATPWATVRTGDLSRVRRVVSSTRVLIRYRVLLAGSPTSRANDPPLWMVPNSLEWSVRCRVRSDHAIGRRGSTRLPRRSTRWKPLIVRRLLGWRLFILVAWSITSRQVSAS
jgi:hypothetical protein